MRPAIQIPPTELLECRRFSFVEGPGDGIASLEVYARPRKNHRYVISFDPAFGIEGRDRTAIEVFDRATKPFEEVASAAGQYPPEELDRILYALAMWYMEADIIGEAQGGGLTSLRTLWTTYGYRRLYRRRREEDGPQRITDRLGFHRIHHHSLYQFRGAVKSGELLLRNEALINEMARLEWHSKKDEISIKAGDAQTTLRIRGGGTRGIAKSPDLIRAAEYGWVGLTEQGRFDDEAVELVDNRHGDREDLDEVWGKQRRR